MSYVCTIVDNGKAVRLINRKTGKPLAPITLRRILIKKLKEQGYRIIRKRDGNIHRISAVLKEKNERKSK
jgi:hypothetical protein